MGRIPERRRWRAARRLTAAVPGLLLVGCAALGSPGSQPASAEGLCWWHEDAALDDVRSFSDILPNTRYRVAGSASSGVPLTPLVVVGRVVEVRAGPGWTRSGERVGFDDDTALWKQVHATVAVSEVLGSAGWTAKTVRVAFPVAAAGRVDVARTMLLSEGDTVIPLYRWAGVDYDPTLWSVGPPNAVLLARVAGDGRLSLPCVGADRADRLLADVPTLADLRRAAAGPVRERLVRPTYRG